MPNLSSGPAKKATDAPFAQSENLVEADYPSSFHLQKHNKQVNDKVSGHLSEASPVPNTLHCAACKSMYACNPRLYHLLISGLPLQVGHGQFDPEVYKANAMANIHNRTQSRARNFVGSGNILSYNK